MSARPPEGVAIVLFWCSESLTRWHLPPEVWQPLEDVLDHVHERWLGSTDNNKAEDYALNEVFGFMYGHEDDVDTAPWADYVVDGASTLVDVPVARFYLTGSDPE